MSYHLVVFSGSVSTTPNTDLPAVSDDVIVVQNNHFLPQRDFQLIFAVGIGANIVRQRIVQPSYRQVVEPQIRPLVLGSAPASDANVADYRRYPLRVRGLEELAVESTSSIAMGNERHYSLLALLDSFEPLPQGDVYTMRGTSTTSCPADVWTTLSVTYDAVLPEGEYALCGVYGIGNGAIAYRAIFENQSLRPGLPAVQSVGQRHIFDGRKGELGILGRFRNYALPQIQCLPNAVLASHTIFLDLVRIR